MGEAERAGAKLSATSRTKEFEVATSWCAPASAGVRRIIRPILSAITVFISLAPSLHRLFESRVLFDVIAQELDCEHLRVAQ